MITIKKMIEELSKYPQDALCYAYEGEITGVVIRHKDEQLGYIYTSENKDGD